MVRRRVARGLLLLGACATGAAAMPAASSASTVQLSPAGSNADSPRVVLDAAGDAFAAWTLETSNESYVIEASIRPAGGAWQAPVVLSEEAKSSDRPAIAVDPQGDAVVVWQGLGDGNQLIGAAVRNAGGAWQGPVTISETGQMSSEPAVAISAGGEATAVWESSNGANPAIQAASHPLSGAWSAPVKISSGGSETSPAVAVNANGGAVAAWISNGNDISGAARRVGSKWGSPSGVPYTEWQPSAPRIGLDMAGDAVAVWGAYHNSEADIRSATLPAGKGWEASVVLASTGGEALADGLSLTESGEATALWTIGTNGSEVLQSSTMPAHGSWVTPAGLTGAEKHLGEALLAVDARGDELVDWESSNGSNIVLRSRSRPAGGAWGSRLNLSGPAESAFLGGAVLSSTGNALALFHSETAGSIRTVQASEYPISSALLGPPSIPAAGVAGVPVAMSIGPGDELTGLASVNWSLGDGATAAGPAISHTYATAGSYAVAVSGLDAFENPFADSARITIAARAPVLGALKQSASSWREGTRLASVASKHKPPVGTTFSFTLNETATLSFAFSTKAGGRRSKGKCVAQSHRNAHARRCTRLIVRGRLQLAGHAGAEHVRFQGLLSKHSRLKPGSYTLTLIAAAQGLHSAPRTLSFKIAG